MCFRNIGHGIPIRVETTRLPFPTIPYRSPTIVGLSTKVGRCFVRTEESIVPYTILEVATFPVTIQPESRFIITIEVTIVPITENPYTTYELSKFPSSIIPYSVVPYTVLKSSVIPSTVCPSSIIPSSGVPSTGEPNRLCVVDSVLIHYHRQSLFCDVFRVPTSTIPITVLPCSGEPFSTEPSSRLPNAFVPSKSFIINTYNSITNLRIQKPSIVIRYGIQSESIDKLISVPVPVDIVQTEGCTNQSYVVWLKLNRYISFPVSTNLYYINRLVI